jgi:hypothetical protein
MPSVNSVYTTIPGAKCCVGFAVENRNHGVCARAERLCPQPTSYCSCPVLALLLRQVLMPNTL